MAEPRDLPLVAVTSLTETLLEVVREESVEDGVDGGVAVLETVREEDDDDQRVSLVVAGRFAEIQKYLCQPPLKLFEILGGFPPYKLFSDRTDRRRRRHQLGIKSDCHSGLPSPYESYLGDPVRQPADDVDRDDSQHQLGHLPVGLPLALRPLLTTRPHGSQFYNDFGKWNNYVSFKLC